MVRTDCVRAVSGRRTFDLLIRNARIVNVYNDTVQEGCIGIVGKYIAYAGQSDAAFCAERIIDAGGAYAVPAFIDAHMHLESSMLLPEHFAQVVIPCGTGTVCADPHEIANAAGFEGLKALVNACRDLPLKILIMAPSTVPSAPGFENSAYDVDGREMERILELPGICGLGEVMDFNGVAGADDRILDVIDTAAERGCILDGHASILTGRRLQAFRAAGIDSDHTVPTPEKLLETLSLGFCSQVQEIMLSGAMVQAMNEIRIDGNICLVTDDVPLPRLMRDGHLNHVASKAVSLGLDPLKAIRFCTINPARRLRLYDRGAIAPGMVCDLMLTDSIEKISPSLVLLGGKVRYDRAGIFAADESCAASAGAGKRSGRRFPKALYHTMHLAPLTEEDFYIGYALPEDGAAPECGVPLLPGKMQDGFRGLARVNLIAEDNVSIRTKRESALLPCRIRDGRFELDTAGCCRMAVFNRHGLRQKGLALIRGLGDFTGAVALTYGHDSHNLMVYGSDASDMTKAANAVISSGGGICAVSGGEILCEIALPIAGLLSEEEPDVLYNDMKKFLAALGGMHFPHKNPVSFFTLMALAVSPEIKCTDKGLLDVVNKRFLPLIEEVLPGSEVKE